MRFPSRFFDNLSSFGIEKKDQLMVASTAVAVSLAERLSQLSNNSTNLLLTLGVSELAYYGYTKRLKAVGRWVGAFNDLAVSALVGVNSMPCLDSIFSSKYSVFPFSILLATSFLASRGFGNKLSRVLAPLDFSQHLSERYQCFAEVPSGNDLTYAQSKEPDTPYCISFEKQIFVMAARGVLEKYTRQHHDVTVYVRQQDGLFVSLGEHSVLQKKRISGYRDPDSRSSLVLALPSILTFFNNQATKFTTGERLSLGSVNIKS
ncbi:MAG: hypothetical protein WCP97_02685 [bacterium]